MNLQGLALTLDNDGYLWGFWSRMDNSLAFTQQKVAGDPTTWTNSIGYWPLLSEVLIFFLFCYTVPNQYYARTVCNCLRTVPGAWVSGFI
jgi:hypothetical protein